MEGEPDEEKEVIKEAQHDRKKKQTGVSGCLGGEIFIEKGVGFAEKKRKGRAG